MMKQPYSCQQEVPEGVRWDRKRSPEPNLHVCGEDGMKRAVHNMKKQHAEREENREKRQREYSEKKNNKKQQNFTCLKEETNCDTNTNPSINERLNRFSFKKVNLVLEHSRSINFIV